LKDLPVTVNIQLPSCLVVVGSLVVRMMHHWPVLELCEAEFQVNIIFAS